VLGCLPSLGEFDSRTLRQSSDWQVGDLPHLPTKFL